MARIGGDEAELEPGRVIRVDPATRGLPTLGAEGLEFITIGAPLDPQYESPEWG